MTQSIRHRARRLSWQRQLRKVQGLTVIQKFCHEKGGKIRGGDTKARVIPGQQPALSLGITTLACQNQRSTLVRMLQLQSRGAW